MTVVETVDSQADAQQELPFALVYGQALTQMPLDLYIPPDALEVFLEAFEGPLDLLLYLIRKQNIDILDIPVAEITKQYMGYVELMKTVRLELAAEYLVMAAMLAGIVMAAAGAGDAGIAAIAGSQAAAIQEQRRFSRQNEQEADRIGILNLDKAGYDPRNMPTMFERLMRQYRFDARPPEFLLTHPVSESRIADTRNRAEQAKPGGKEDSVLYQLMRARVALIYEETPGIAAKRFRAQLVENPKSEAARYGLAIAQIKGGQLNEARESLKPLLEKSPNDITYNLTQIELDITNNRLPDAQQRVDRMLTLYPNNYPLNDVRIDVLLKQNRTAEAEKSLEALLKTRPDDPDIWYVVAETRGLNGNTVGLHQARAEYFALVGDFRQAIQQLDFAKRRSANNFQLASRIDARQKDLIEQERMVKEMMN